MNLRSRHRAAAGAAAVVFAVAWLAGAGPPAVEVTSGSVRAAGAEVRVLSAGTRAGRPVLVAPSMSGRYAFPFALEGATRLSGLVLVAPVGVRRYREELHRVAVPTLVVWGERDRVVPLGLADVLVRGIPGARKVVLPGAGHACYLDRPERFHRELLSFLDRVCGGAARR